MSKVKSVALAMVLLNAGCGAGPAVEPAELVLRNGRVVTMDADVPEAESVAMAGGRVVAVGSDADLEAYVGPDTEVIDLEGRLAVPGFIEGHGHFMGVGRARMILDLSEIASWDEAVEMVAAAAEEAEPGEWILGRGWHQEKWDEVPEGAVEGLPTHRSMSAVSPSNPVFLNHASGHASFANAMALELAGIGPDTPSRPGGEIVRDAGGAPTGILRENDQDAVEEALAHYNSERSEAEVREELKRAIRLASEELLSRGVTSFQDAGSSFATIDLFREVAEAGDLPVRLYVMVRYETNEAMAERLPDYRMVNAAGGHLTVRSIKRQIDGALGSHGAWLLAPYTDMRSSDGLVLEPVEDIRRTAEIAIQHGFQVNTHAIGDRANREVLDLYESVFATHPEGTDLRWRIEHAQHIDPADVPRFAELGVIASMQGIHATSDWPWVGRRLGEERAASTSYLWRDLLDSGAVVTNGTDAPVERVDPMPSFYAMVARRTADGTPFMPEQKLTREEALRSYTLDNAYAAFEEDVKGSITPGKYGDIVVLSRDITTVPEEQILDTEVVYTIVGGRVVYRDEGVDATT